MIDYIQKRKGNNSKDPEAEGEGGHLKAQGWTEDLRSDSALEALLSPSGPTDEAW